MKKTILFIFCFCFSKAFSQIDTSTFIELQSKKQFFVDIGTGKPTVVMLTGLGVSMEDFFETQKEVSKTTRVFLYDRAGIGKSEELNKERIIENMCVELKQLIDKIGITEPFILVGHSRGGSLAKYFLNQYPNLVCGLILLDAPDASYRWFRRELRTESEKSSFDSLPKVFYTNELPPTIKNEMKHARLSDSSVIAKTKFPTNIPGTIITSTQIGNEKYSQLDNQIKRKLVERYRKEAPQIKLIFTGKSGHFNI